MSSRSLLSERSLGVFPITIASSLAIEALANLTPDRDPVYPLGITRFDSLMINVHTLIRNIESAFRNDDVIRLTVEDIADTVIQDMDNIVKAMREITPHDMSVGFYLCEYRSINKLKAPNLIKPTTPGQIARHEKTSKVIGLLMDNMKKGGRKIKVYDMYPLASDYGNDRVAFMTHLPYDLMEHRRFNGCLLLESNTGRLKDRSEFYTKLHKKVEGVEFPLNQLTIQVFGDGKMFKPMNTDIVNAVIEVARKSKWTSSTTAEKMRFGLRGMQLQGYAEMLVGLVKD